MWAFVTYADGICKAEGNFGLDVVHIRKVQGLIVQFTGIGGNSG